ncbi:hypothetical protein FKN01_14130 [Streptomyces sp. 130]|uniref:hypothetical protein n=1 Tax=Streptomyces sp. 130 TaxID=2591006 RepID=UPI00117ED93A|nr:hypothetical protein [Streptomyces sp. 130]TRV78044.1 hypothetical protein FKN01_14130 [Streptomyces sp. 130]
MTKDTDPTPRPTAAPTSRPDTGDRAAGGASPYFSDDGSARPPRTAPPAPPAVSPVPLAEKDLGHKHTDDTTRQLVPGRDGRAHTSRDGAGLLPAGDQDRLAHRLHQAVTDFVESPHRAVEEAESTFDAVVAGLTDALKERRSALHVGERDGGDPGARTEELRITLQHYRDLTERLLKV